MQTKLTRLDIATWCGFMIFAASGVITPMCLPEISKNLSTDLSEGGGMESARAFVIFIFYALLAIAGLAAACFWPTILAEAALCLKTDSTILFVLLACFGIAGFGVTPWIMGVIGDIAGLKAGFSMIPGLFLGLIIVLAVEWRMRRTCSKRPGQAG